MKRILVTGACGSIGGALTEHLLGLGHTVCAFDNNEDAIFRLKLKYEQSEFQDNIRYFYGDVRDRDRLIQAMSGVGGISLRSA